VGRSRRRRRRRRRSGKKKKKKKKPQPAHIRNISEHYACNYNRGKQ